MARRSIYDNMKTAADKVKKGKGRIVNERFATMCAHYLRIPANVATDSGDRYRGAVLRVFDSMPGCFSG